MKELGEGTRYMTVTTTGWDINPRVLGVVPKEAAVSKLDGFHWVADAQFMAVPKGIGDDKLAVILDLMNYMLTPEAQAVTYDQGIFIPVPLSRMSRSPWHPSQARMRLLNLGALNMPIG